jgi:Family of unknown function (DUF5703)
MARRVQVQRRPDYEYERLKFDRSSTRSNVQALLAARAEIGSWEIDRLRLYPDGSRVVILRRRIIRARSTMAAT